VTPTGGETSTTTFSASKPHRVEDIVSCTFDIVRTTPESTFHGFGTFTYFITPAS